jgi:transcriptional regulator of acetoin/glycerol metabolism
VRELRLAIERAGCLVENGTLPPGAVRDAIALGMPRNRRTDRRTGDRRQQTAERRRQSMPTVSSGELLNQCKANGWNAVRLAKSLGIPRSTLYCRLKAAGISLRACRRSEKSESARSTEFRPSRAV